MHPRMIKKRIFYEKNALQARFLWNQRSHRQHLWNKMRRRPDFLTKSSWVLCPVNAIRKLFSTNLSSESSCFNQCINRLINLWPAYSTYVFPTGPACGIVSLLGTCIAECCSVLQHVTACYSILQCVAACYSVLQRVAACCSMLQCVVNSALQCIVLYRGEISCGESVKNTSICQ